MGSDWLDEIANAFLLGDLFLKYWSLKILDVFFMLADILIWVFMDCQNIKAEIWLWDLKDIDFGES